MPYGPNMTRLIASFIPINAIPRGGGLKDGIKFFSDPVYRQSVMDKSEADALESIRVIHSAIDDPYKDYDDEVIAGILLDKIQERKNKQRMKYD